MTLLRRRGQSTGEYAILFAIVLGAVFAVQNYLRNRIAGTIKAETDDYLVNLEGADPMVPNIASSAEQRARMTMDSATVGIAESESSSISMTIAEPE